MAPAEYDAREILEMLVEIPGAAEPEEPDLSVSETDVVYGAELESAIAEPRNV